MPKVRLAAVIGVVLSLALAGAAFAAKVTGGTTQVTASSAAATLLANNHITVAALAPATSSGATFTFPIARGHVNATTKHGVIFDRGGISLSNGTKTVAVRDFTIVSTKNGVSIDALIRGRVVHHCRLVGLHRHGLRCTTIVTWHVGRIATVSNVALNGTTATGTVNISALTAGLINDLAGKSVVHAGDVLGTATVTPTLA
jgi:hypothetical protein